MFELIQIVVHNFYKHFPNSMQNPYCTMIFWRQIQKSNQSAQKPLLSAPYLVEKNWHIVEFVFH